MIDSLLSVLRISITLLIIYVIAQLLQGIPVAPWLAWVSAVIFTIQLAIISSPKKRE